ncbi:purine and uridine phosphorylase [Aspergillus californicus]
MTPLTHADYTVACICPLGLEQAPLEALLDETHDTLPTSHDRNSYTLGRMGTHNIIIACMPTIGNNSAAICATQLLNDFPCVRFSLLIGIGGGIPDAEAGVDIRLGDVVVSKPEGTFGGVVQFDRGKAVSGSRGAGGFERTGMLSRPPDVLLATVKRLEALHRRVESRIPEILGEMLRRYPRMERGGYIYQGSENDRLFRSGYGHAGNDDCRLCDEGEILRRRRREDSTPVIHYGTIGSSNAVIKDCDLRERLKRDLNILCVDMEAAGLMDSFPCLVVRGISDYADSHKNDRWQPYAAAAAAAYAKELLALVPPLDVPSLKAGRGSRLRGETMIRAGNIGNLVNGPVTGSVVGGDEVHGDKFMQNNRC